MGNIKSALISVFHKEGLEPVLQALNKLNIQIYSTGGTQKFIEESGFEATSVEDITEYPSIFGGRVKTLHPKVFGGILARREQDRVEMEEYEIPPIDLVIVDLYPFVETLRSGEDHQEIIEKIDIGGISLIRAAAKNYRDVLIIPSRKYYPDLLEMLNTEGGRVSEDQRKKMAARAFAISAGYDRHISSYLGASPALDISAEEGFELRYGENPHQKGNFYGAFHALFDQLHGKQVSYNNLVDIDAAIGLVEELEEVSFVVIKHTNPCGVATRDTLVDAWKDAFAGDTVSAFGGILATNATFDAATAAEINKLFFEIIIAPGYEEGALETLKTKKNRIILIQKRNLQGREQVKSILDGYLVQDVDDKRETGADLETVTEKAPGAGEVEDLLIANRIVKHAKSNAIVLVKDKQLVGIGVGQTSRVDALKQAIEKARRFNLPLEGAVMASDAFFPFADSVEIAHEAGIRAVIQPGGSIRDKESIEYCNAHDMAMVFTGTRHFKH